ncbi:hypothetical protein AB4Y95_00160 [Arthrobacter sp. M-10]|uniref:hypothetical protein n=1 Tax=Arthrobacter sp. M-10 TaxID=3233037 RepID=UPI003F8F445C
MASNGMTYEIVMDAVEVEAVLTETATLFPRYINSWLVESANLTKEEMASKVSRGVGATMGQGIANNIGIDYNVADMSATIKPTDQVPYADGVETGTRPHMPPAGPDSSLAQWCELHGLNVWAVAMSIKRKGTKPHPFVEPTYQVVIPQVTERFTSGVSAFLERRTT